MRYKLLLAVVLLAVFAADQLESRSSEPVKERPLTNQDVVKLAKLGFGEQVIVEKINQAAEVNFSLDVDSLDLLQKEGVSQGVIGAMIRKASLQDRVAALQRQAGIPELSVELAVSTGAIKLKGLDYSKSELRYSKSLLFSTTYAIKEAKAQQVISQQRPTIVITTFIPQEDTTNFFLIRFEVGKGERLYKMAGGSNIVGKSPSEKIQLKFDAERPSSKIWHLVPKEDLKPGEYAVLIYSPIDEIWTIFDFGVG